MKFNREVFREAGLVISGQIHSITACAALIFMGLNAQSQITIADYQKEIHCSVDELKGISDVMATSVAGKVYTHKEESSFSGGCLGTLVRTFHFSDDGGNSAIAEQYIFLTDTIAPVLIGVPENMTVSADEVPKPANVNNRDNSGRFYVVYFSEKKTSSEIRRTWTCEDDCGNVATATQVITIASR